MKNQHYSEAFLKNRAELLPDDVWGQFVVPHFIGSSPVLKEKKAVKIEGGRGCGKTMLMRYLCHSTTFSRKRKLIPDSALEFIGLYWKPDIRFCKLLKSAWLGDEADVAFAHYFTISVLEALCDCVESMAMADFESGILDLRKVALPNTLRSYFPKDILTFDLLRNHIKSERSALDLWVQNPKLERPLMFGFKDVLNNILEVFLNADKRLKDSFYRIFVDEFENLQPSQQRIINDYIKQPQTLFCVSFSVRSHAISEFFTSTDEQLIDPHDYRTINIEEQLLKGGRKNFELLAAEVVLLRLSNEGFDIQFPNFKREFLFDPRFLPERNEDLYKSAVLNRVKEIFPQTSVSEIASHACNDPALKNRLEKTIKLALKQRGIHDITTDIFFDKVHPTVSIVAASVLHRGKLKTSYILEQLELSISSPERSEFTKRDGGWVENTLHGSILYLYKGLPNRENLLYSGFGRYCGMTRPNLRYFQELCHQAFLESELRKDSLVPMVVSPEIQAFAAKQVSTKLLNEVERAGANGKNLHKLIMRLGHLFEAAQRRPSQGESEVNHFSIDDAGSIGLKNEVSLLLKDALMWSVLYRTDDTKNKVDYDIVQNDYVPNPIYAPYFGISYRKKRKLALTAVEINTIFLGTGMEYQNLLRSYTEKWEINSENDSRKNYDLFT
ncbi:hypothetical protein H8K32_09985 [Undibacterium jejuense]|uniref:Uncharacterized protein n=1 Tax=Undibacterium jejuense TaxID=1344949 RepID=A0A923HIP4_9BURK|nr:hypothetical protein [Undibacterium jejuense]MBC3862427.1 hypothetical protein [Undibacterium jejuense]